MMSALAVGVGALAQAATSSLTPNLGLFEELYRQTTPSSTTPASCY
jgi:hypothetical protein